jgi:hypothetical protein
VSQLDSWCCTVGAADQGQVHRVIVDISGEHVEDYEAQMKITLARQ